MIEVDIWDGTRSRKLLDAGSKNLNLMKRQ